MCHSLGESAIESAPLHTGLFEQGWGMCSYYYFYVVNSGGSGSYLIYIDLFIKIFSAVIEMIVYVFSNGQ